jgi:hypothetical protein
MRPMTADERLFWRSDTCRVWVGYTESGGLRFSGEDADDYEYEVSVAPAQFDTLRAALGGATGESGHEDLVDLVCRRVDDIMPMGEARWLDAHKIEHRVTVR